MARTKIQKSANQKKWYYKNKKRILKKRKKYYKNNTDKWYTHKTRYLAYKRRAEEHGLAFDITFEDFKDMILDKCYYCNDDGHGIDRVNNSIGYIDGNMVPCCSVCNFMKRNLDLNQFIEKCMKITNKFNK